MFFFFFPDNLILEDARWNAVSQILEKAQITYPDITASSLRTFIHFATSQSRILEKKLPIKTIAAELGITYTTITRQIDILGAGVGGHGGQGLIEKITEGRMKRVELTGDGMNLMRAMYVTLDRMSVINPSPQRKSRQARLKEE